MYTHLLLNSPHISPRKSPVCPARPLNPQSPESPQSPQSPQSPESPQSQLSPQSPLSYQRRQRPQSQLSPQSPLSYQRRQRPQSPQSPVRPSILCFQCEDSFEYVDKLINALIRFEHPEWRMKRVYPGFVTAHHPSLDRYNVYLNATPGFEGKDLPIEVIFEDQKCLGLFDLSFNLDVCIYLLASPEGFQMKYVCEQYIAALTWSLPKFVALAERAK
jgi:hypothetical protein